MSERCRCRCHNTAAGVAYLARHTGAFAEEREAFRLANQPGLHDVDVTDPVAAVFACPKCRDRHCPALLARPERIAIELRPISQADGVPDLGEGRE